MKKLYTIVAVALGISATLHAQQEIMQMTPVQVHGINPNIAPLNVTDTITNYLDRATGFYTLRDSSGGYIFGTSGATNGTGCHYTSVGSAHVTELMVYFGHKTIINTADNLTAGVLLVGADSMPTTLVSSGSVSVSNCDVSGFPTFIPMTNYVNQSGDFFVMISYSGIDDTISLISSNPTTNGGGPDGNNEKRVRQNTTSIFFSRAWDLWTINNQPYNADVLILPIMDIATGIDDSLSMGGFAMQAPYPSPAQNNVTIPFSVDRPQEVNLVVYNAQGQPVTETNLGTVNGSMNYQIDCSNYANGTYFFVLSGPQGRIASKFTIAR